MIDSVLLLDSLIVASLAGGLLLVLVLTIPRRALAHHLQHQLVAYGLLSLLVVGTVSLVWRPGPVGCLTGPCAEPLAQTQAREAVQRHFLFAGAGKFTHEVPPPWDVGTTAAAAATPRAVRVVLLVWLGGLAFFFFRTVRSHLVTMRLIRQATAIDDQELLATARRVADDMGLRAPIRLARHPRAPDPIVAGSLRPTVFLPSRFAGDACPELEMVLIHELAHVRRRHGLASLFGELVSVLFWFHPLVWLGLRRLRELHELAADQQVVASGIRPSRYARYLLATFRELRDRRPRPVSAAHAMIGGGLLDARLRAILEPKGSSAPPSRMASVALAALFLLFCAALSFAPASLQATGEGPAGGAGEIDRSYLNPEALDSILRPVFINKMADSRIAGASVAVVFDGKVIYRAGFGEREAFGEQPVDPDRTIFRIGSITKVLTGVAVLQLVDRGLLDLDADVNRYLDTLQVPPTFDEPVRVRHLLTHTAGFDQIGLGRQVGSRSEVRPLRDFLSENLIRIRPPGKVSCYDTYGITLAGYLVEKVSGLSYEDYLEKYIFEPLGMHRSGIVVPPSFEADVATGYEFDGEWRPQRWEFMNTDPASTVNSTAADMARFALMLLQGGELAGQRILSPSSARAMHALQHTNHPDHAGYGFTLWEDRVFGVPAWSHGGSMTGFASFLYLVPEHRLGVFVAYNQESGALAGAALSELVAKLFPHREEGPELRERWKEALELEPFTGSYANNVHNHTDPDRGWRRRPFEVTAQDGAILFQGAAAYPVGPLAFQREDGLLLTFAADEDGHIRHLFVNQTVYEKLP